MFKVRQPAQELMSHQLDQEMQLILVTPELAASWLQCNTNNRPLQAFTVGRYAAEMSAKTWRHPTGEALIFDKNNIIQQGQHRLHAVIKSGQTIRFWVMFNADPDDFEVIDSGVKRTIANVLQMQGGKYATTSATTSRLLCMWMANEWDSKLCRSTIVQFHNQYFDSIQKASKVATNSIKGLRLAPTHFSALYAYVDIMSESTDQIDNFTMSLTNGDMLAKDSPVLALRNWSYLPKAYAGLSSQQKGVAVITKAWNAYSVGAPMKLLSWKLKESMPTPLPSQY